MLCEFERGIRKFGSQRQSGERGALRIAIDNLARTAGYPDPSRFIWAIEAAKAGALADGPVTANDGDVKVTLSVDRKANRPSQSAAMTGRCRASRLHRARPRQSPNFVIARRF